jgi:uncharacterized coiled-coil protein SlyX
MEEMQIGDVALAGSGWLALIGKMLWEKFVSTEGKASDTLISSLEGRIASQEQRLNTLEAALDEERRARRQAEDKIHKLELDNMQLRMELKRHNITVPHEA